MNYANIPTKFTYYWAQGASGTYVRQIPMPAQSGGTAGFYTGFPSNCFSPVASGGTPPDGRDMNGVLQMLSQWAQWQQLGAPVEWDSSLSAAVSGYPAGAVVQAASGPGAGWLNTVDGNTTNPDASGAGWTAIYPYTGTAAKWTTARTVTFSGGAVTGSFSIDGSANVAGVSLAIAAGAVGSTQLAGGAVTSGAIATGAVTNGAIAAGAVGSTQLASSAVTSGAIASGAVTSGALAAGCVGSSALATGAVTTTAIASGNVTNVTMAAMAAGTVKANITGGSAAPSDVTLSAFTTALALPLVQKAYVTNLGGSIGFVGSGGIVKLAVGTYQWNFGATMPDTNYIFTPSMAGSSGSGAFSIVEVDGSRTTSSVQINVNKVTVGQYDPTAMSWRVEAQ